MDTDMRHEKYLAYAAAGMPLDEILTHFERDLLTFLGTVEDEFERDYIADHPEGVN